MVGVSKYQRARVQVAKFCREHRRPGENKEDMFLRHVPVYNLRSEERKDADNKHYGAVLAQELSRITTGYHLERIVTLSEEINIPGLCIAHSIEAPHTYLGEYAARQHGITQLHPNADVPFFIDSPLDHQLYLELFDIAAWNVLFNEAEIRRQGIFSEVMRIGKYAARGVAAAQQGDYSRDYLRFDWQVIADKFKDIVAAYEEPVTHDKAQKAEPEDPDWIQQRDAFLNKQNKKKW